MGQFKQQAFVCPRNACNCWSRGKLLSMQNLGVGMALQWMVKPFLGVLVARTAASVWNLEPGIATGLILVS